ncbi:arylsulfatase [Streptomyces sp. NBC_01618]|uniref:arylsulfatase n=1 Tax=Streptomyces sp. NBC_01618 TaxID=2975900 RepID=UPI00386EF8DB|nr:arylsulfatase [Streptomyces sp. NBC_01618]
MSPRPNVVVVLLDDVGFGAPGTFGGPVDTPTLDALADDGLRYNRFHTTAICSPTRASLLTGRDPHVTGVGTVLNSAFDHPAYKGVLRAETATVARTLQENGYSTACVGKWHLAPAWESSQAGPFTRWPTGQGFDTFYGFLGGETHQFEPTLYEGTAPVERPDRPDYHLTEDLVDRSISWIRMQRTMTPGRPFFLYLAPGATHAPLHVPGAWSEKYRGRFDEGWDAMREATPARQKAAGILPADTCLTPRPVEIPAWADVSEDERTVAARLMEVYAGFLEHTDVHIGRLVDELKASGEFENTLFCYVVGDNGSSAEGGLPGSINYMGALQGMQESTRAQVAGIDRIGGPDSYAQYPAGWAWAMTAPFQWMKQIASHLGGTRNPMVLTWPAGITDRGAVREQFTHVNDLAPKILELAGIAQPDTVDGVAQLPMDGTSLAYSFADPEAPERHETQYFEVNGHRSIYHRGWMASAHPGGVPWTVGRPGTPRPFEDDEWELYDLRSDFSQAHDLAQQEPERLAELTALFSEHAERVGILPLHDARVSRTPMPNLVEDRTSFTFHAGTVGIPESQAPRMVGRSWHLRAVLDVGEGTAQGVVASMGGRAAGWALWLDPAGRPVLTYRTFEIAELVLTGTPLAPGRHQVEVVLRYDGGGRGRGATIGLVVDGKTAEDGRVVATPPAVFSIDETFDIGPNTGSPVGDYPVINPFRGGTVARVDIELDG